MADAVEITVTPIQPFDENGNVYVHVRAGITLNVNFPVDMSGRDLWFEATGAFAKPMGQGESPMQRVVTLAPSNAAGTGEMDLIGTRPRGYLINDRGNDLPPIMEGQIIPRGKLAPPPTEVAP